MTSPRPRCAYCGAHASPGATVCGFCRTPIETATGTPDSALIAATDFHTGAFGRFKPSTFLASTSTTLTTDTSRGVVLVRIASTTALPALSLLESHDFVSVSTGVRFLTTSATPLTFAISVRGSPKARYAATLWSTGTVALSWDSEGKSEQLWSAYRHASYRPGEHNELSVIAKDNRFRVYLNGDLTGSARDARGTAGYVSTWFGAHGTPTAPNLFELSDIVVREAT